MSPYHHELIHILRYCRFLPGSFDKRFVLDLAAYDADKYLTEKQEDTIEKIAYRYRSQIYHRTGRVMDLSDDLKPKKKHKRG